MRPWQRVQRGSDQCEMPALSVADPMEAAVIQFYLGLWYLRNPIEVEHTEKHILGIGSVVPLLRYLFCYLESDFTVLGVCRSRLADIRPAALRQNRDMQYGPSCCQGCGYCVTGVTSNRCPECGKSFEHGDEK